MTIKNTLKTRGSNKLFKAGESLNQETAIITYIENGATKTATFRNAGCKDRATAKMQELRAHGAQIVSYTA